MLERNALRDWLLLDYRAQERYVRDKLELFQAKYPCSFEEFEQRIEATSQENMREWDDYIVWNGYADALREILVNIEDVTHGNFQVA